MHLDLQVELFKIALDILEQDLQSDLVNKALEITFRADGTVESDWYDIPTPVEPVQTGVLA
jgi:hypothetical protein